MRRKELMLHEIILAKDKMNKDLFKASANLDDLTDDELFVLEVMIQKKFYERGSRELNHTFIKFMDEV